MEEIDSITGIETWRSSGSGSVGLVPTMGYLHAGHSSLIAASVAENERTVVSLFVNPSQFNEQSDYDQYPRDTEKDLKICRELGADVVFNPDPVEIYPPGFDTWVTVEKLTERLEGEHRPGHFRGVATVVFLLFQLVKPRRAYFGRKDAQQLLVVQRMARDLHTGVEVIGLQTVREGDGLALSSRNARLSSQQRAVAPVLHRALERARSLYHSGTRDVDAVKTEMEKMITAEPGIDIDYISIADPKTLQEQETFSSPALVSLAAFLGDVRLIDNVMID